MSVDTELDAWRREWQSERPASPDLAARVQRGSRFMHAMLAGEVLVTVVIGGTTTAWAARSSEPDVMMLAAAVWLFVAAAWTFALRNRRGCWTPAALSTSAFLDLSIRRCRSGMASAMFGVVLYFCEILFCLIWIYRRTSASTGLSPLEFLSSRSISVVWICTAAFVVFVMWYRRRKQAELSYLLKLNSELEAPDCALER